ncbi:hypothetical protein [Emticicia sp.]|uniref:hypothetical protein n=1 Tax=Emticicia sp. TaxID=1930953 RepID=UPI0037513FDA
MRNVIIGTAYNYSKESMLPFLNSLEKTGFKGDLIFFINNSTEVIYDKYSFKLKLINFEKQNRWYIRFFKYLEYYTPLFIKDLIKFCITTLTLRRLKKGRSLPNWVFSKYYLDYYVATSRFMLYYSYLKQNEYDNVFLTDTRDVIFQEDIFKKIEANKVYAFEENGEIILEKENWNKQWIIAGYGNDVFEEIKQNNIYCSGTILGDYESICHFLNDYTSHIIRDKIPNKMEGFDQGIFNYFISYKKLPYFTKLPNGNRVFTVGMQKMEDIKIVDNKIYYEGHLDLFPSVIHQYDRHVTLREFILSCYV